MTNNDKEIVRTLKNHIEAEDCVTCESFGKCNEFLLTKNTLDLINRQRAEIERLHDEVSKTRRKALLEASSKFAGHSDYHGDTILCKLICMADGKEVEIATPLDKSEIKSEAIKKFAEMLKEKTYPFPCATGVEYAVTIRAINDAVKEMVGDAE